MEIAAKQIMIPLILLTLQICVVAWINIKIKFAPSENDAKKAILDAVFRALIWSVNLACIGYLVFRAFREEPVSRLEVFIIVGIPFQIILLFLIRLIDALIGKGKKA